MTKKKGNIVPY